MTTKSVEDRLQEAEDAAMKAEEKFSSFFSAASALIAITTFKEGRLLDLNEVALQALGYEREELIDRTVHQGLIWESAEERDKALQLLEEQGSITDLELTMRGKSGQTTVCLLSAEVINFEGEKCVLSISKDITKRKQAEEEIWRLNDDLTARTLELQTVNKELEAFNYMVAHDLRTPLNTINMCLQSIQMMCGKELKGECSEYTKKAYDTTLRMSRMIGALLDFSRMAHLELRKEPLVLSAMANEVAMDLRQTEPERDVSFLIADGIEADADASLLRVVLDNLMGNAWKYSASQKRSVIEFGATTMDGKEVYYVRDNGPGFEEAEQEMIFVPFHRLKGTEKAKGFGIGLATVERIIQRHGGRIWAKGEPMKGACFYFTLT